MLSSGGLKCKGEVMWENILQK